MAVLDFVNSKKPLNESYLNHTISAFSKQFPYLGMISYGDLGKLLVIDGEITIIPSSLRKQKLDALH